MLKMSLCWVSIDFGIIYIFNFFILYFFVFNFVYEYEEDNDKQFRGDYYDGVDCNYNGIMMKMTVQRNFILFYSFLFLDNSW